MWQNRDRGAEGEGEEETPPESAEPHRGTQSQGPETMTRTEIDSKMPNQLNHPDLSICQCMTDLSVGQEAKVINELSRKEPLDRDLKKIVLERKWSNTE